VNPFLEDMLGYAYTELIGKALWEIGPVKGIGASREAMRNLQRQAYSRYENLPVETKDGQMRQVEFVSNAYWVDGSRVIQCNIRDVTTRKLTEASFQTAHTKLIALVAELQRHDVEMHLLNRMTDLLQASTTPAEAYQVIARMADEVFTGQAGALAIWRAEHQRLETVARWGDGALVAPSFAREDCWALRRGQLYEATNPPPELLCRHFVYPPQSGYVCLPLAILDETLGVLCVMAKAVRSGEHQTHPPQLTIMVGEAIRLSLSNLNLREELREQATHDPLTGLFNRRYLQENLARELHRAQRRKTSLCVVMLDLDYFKRFNDTFGHAAGDSLLREFGRILRERLRRSDIACRYGGEEFVLILPDSSLADTRQRVEQIRALVHEMRLRHGEQLLGAITVSSGIAQARADDETVLELLRAADEALYAAKRAGRDCVVVHQAAA
jgi:diguanylate cyclase (GGDEF)-like protein/PAS domain S-box-containing protein